MVKKNQLNRSTNSFQIDKFRNKSIGKINDMQNMSYVLSIIAGLIYLFIAYKYLDNLKTCSCAKSQAVINLKNSEALLMIMLLFWILLSLWFAANVNDMTEDDILRYLFLSGVFGIVTFLIYIYFCFNVYIFQKTVTSSCSCSLKWQRWLVYIQGWVYLFDIVIVALSVFLSLLFMRR